MKQTRRSRSLVAALLAIALTPLVGSGQLVISQYVETDSGTTPKGIELWNAGETAIDFSVTPLDVLKGVNGGAPGSDFTLNSGTLAAGAVWVIGTSDMGTYLDNTFGVGSVNYSEKAFTFNGNDSLVVTLGGVTNDIFGEPGVDPGSAWTGNGVSTANQNIQLLEGITTGATASWTDPSERFETVSEAPSDTGGLQGFGVAPILGDLPFTVTVDLLNGSVIPEGVEVVVTATASNGLEPYTYDWTSTLDGAHYTALDNVFTILDTAPAGSYSATVTVTDDDLVETNRTISFDVVTAYAINVDSAVGGTVTTDPAGFATEGTTVTITATPEAGYDLGLISVAGADSTPVDLTGNTFTMPGQAVTVSATFEEISAPPGVLAWFLASSANSNAPVQSPAFLETGLSLADDGITGTGSQNVLLKIPTSAWIDEYHYAHAPGSAAYQGARGENGYILTIDAVEGTTFSLSSVSFRHRATATGPGQVGVKVNGVEFSGTGDTASTDVGTYQSEDLGLAELTQAIIYIQGWASGGSGNGEFQINDIQIAGVVDGEGPGPVDPAAQNIVSFSVSGGTASVSLGGSEAGVNYVLTYSDTIGNTNAWTTVGAAIGGDGSAIGPFPDDGATNAAGFYRIEATTAP
jgi:hypothetical protein